VYVVHWSIRYHVFVTCAKLYVDVFYLLLHSDVPGSCLIATMSLSWES